jgi:uracil-DNA glycosylase
MRVCDQVRCRDFPCLGVIHAAHAIPAVNTDASAIRVILVSETPPADAAQGYEGGPDALFAQTTVASFRDAGFDVTSLDEERGLGVHLTTAVKCAKAGPTIPGATIRACSALLERELALFPDATAVLLMGDTAIRTLNEIARRNHEPRPVPAVPTYRIRGGEFRFRGLRVFPSYVQAGPAYFIERGKRVVIAEAISSGMAWAGRGALV